MNLDDLISKYLDGELKPDEDKMLRDLTADDKDSKDTFDSAVVINSACRDDAANIIPPAAFLEQTESKIMMRILAEQPIIEEKLALVYEKRRKRMFAFTIAAVLIFGFLNISDLMLNDYKPMMVSMLYEQRARMEKQFGQTSPETEQKAVLKNSERPVRRIANDGLLATNSGSTGGAGSIPGLAAERNIRAIAMPVQSFRNSENKPVSFGESSVSEDFKVTDSENLVIKNPSNEVMAYNAISTNPISDPIKMKSSGLPVNSSKAGQSFNNIMQNGTFDFYSHRTAVQLTSFFGTDLARMSLNVNQDAVISHFSQSLGYPVDKTNVVGVEFGYTQYNYNDKIMVSVPVSSSASKSSQIEVINPGDETGVKINVPIDYKREKQIIWGTAYYEKNLVDWDKFTLNGRIGVGASSDGFMSFGRLFGKFELFPGFALTVGADARAFKARIVTAETTTDGIRGTASLIYGFQLKF